MLNKIVLSDPMALGNDGSQAMIFLRPPVSTGKWIVHLHGGGLCYNYDSCQIRQANDPALMTFNGLPSAYPVSGILSSDPAVNPWNNFGALLIPYRTSDFFGGGGDSGDWKFRGRYVLLAALNYIDQTYGPIQELILSGSSAGGVGVLASIDWVTAWVTSIVPAAKVKGLCDAGWLLDKMPFDPLFLSPREQADLGAVYWHGNGAGVLYLSTNFTSLVNKNNVFVQIAQYDQSQLQALGVVNGSAEEIAYCAQFRLDVIASLVQQGVTGYYCPKTNLHGLALGTSWTTNYINSLSLRDTMLCWYLGLPGGKQVGT